MLKRILAFIFGASTIIASGQNNEFIDGAYEGLQLQTAAHAETWGLGNEENWSVDMNEGTLTFTFEDGKSAITEIQIIGTYNSSDGTFLWGWDHPSVSSDLAKHALLAKKWGKKNNDKRFTTLQLSCSEDEVWRLAALTNRVANANGVYRGISGSTMVFMTFDKIQMNK